MNALKQWVDANPPPSETRFSPRRAGKLFVAFMISGMLANLPYALLNLGLALNNQAQEERERQERINKGIDQLRESVKDGSAGEATMRLFGVPPTDRAKN